MQEQQPQLRLRVPIDAPQVANNTEALCQLYIPAQLHQKPNQHLLGAFLHVISNVLDNGDVAVLLAQPRDV